MAEEIQDDDVLQTSFNASDPEQVAKKRRTAGRKNKADQNIVKGVMSSKEGRAWMFGVLDACHIYSTSFTGDALTSAFREGERNIGLKLIGSVTRSAPDEYALMLKESNTND
jgi:hypothetical protein